MVDASGSLSTSMTPVVMLGPWMSVTLEPLPFKLPTVKSCVFGLYVKCDASLSIKGL